MTDGQLASLRENVDSTYRTWDRVTKAWGAFHGTVAISTIVLPLLVAGASGIEASPLAGLVPWIPLLAVLASVAAGLQQALRPAERWHSYQSHRSAARRLLTDLQVREASPDELAVLKSRWEELETKHEQSLA